MKALPCRWGQRAEPLSPEGLVALGVAADALVRRLQDAPLAHLRAAALGGPAGLVLLGPTEQLPWIDGIHWIARTPEVPHLFLPTTLAPAVHPALLYEALATRAGPGPLILLPSPQGTGLLVRLGSPAPLTAALLAGWPTGAT